MPLLAFHAKTSYMVLGVYWPYEHGDISFFWIISVVYDTHEGFKLFFAYFTDFRSTVASLLKIDGLQH